MNYYVYVLRSLKDGKQYIGYTRDPDRRLEEHNRGSAPATKNRRPLEMIYKESFTDRAAAIKYERKMKRYKSSSFINQKIKAAKKMPAGFEPASRSEPRVPIV